MGRAFRCAVLLVSVVLVNVAPAMATSSVVVSQFRTQGVANGDFVELLNVSNAPVTLSGWSLFNQNAGPSVQCAVVVNISPTITLQPGQHYLFGQSAAVGTGIHAPDANLTQDANNAQCSSGFQDTAGAFNLSYTAGDSVAYGAGTSSQGEQPSISTVPSNGSSLRRKNNGYQDTDNNNADFEIVAANPLNSTVIDPVPVTGTAGNVTQTGAVLQGSVNPHNGTISNCHFDYGTTTAYGQTAPCASTPTGNSSVAVSASVSNLTVLTAYHFRLVVTAAGGTFTASDGVFTTLPPKASGSTTAATAITASSATLNGSINANGQTITDCHFEYGTSTAYGQSVVCTPTPSGSSLVAVSAAASGLTPSTLYHFRVVAVDAGGTFIGDDMTFTTTAAGGGGGGGGGGGTGPTAVAVISALKLSPSTFKAASSGGSIAAVAIGTTISYRVSQQSTTKFTVLQPARGVRKGKLCVAPPKHPAKGKKKPRSCQRLINKGSFMHSDTQAGAVSFRFTGRVRGHKLAAGSYRLQSVGSNAKGKGKAKLTSFKIVAR